MRVTAPSPSPTTNLWTRASITRLLHALILCNRPCSQLYTLLPSHPSSIIDTLLSSLSTICGSLYTDILHHTANVQLSSSLVPSTCKKRLRARNRVTVRLTPFDDFSLATVSSAGHHPFVEVVLKQTRPCWHVVNHLYTKWSLPFQLVDEMDRAFDINTPVSQLPKVNNNNKSTIVCMKYKVKKLNIQWNIISQALKSKTQVKAASSSNLVQEIGMFKKYTHQKEQNCQDDTSVQDSTPTKQPVSVITASENKTCNPLDPIALSVNPENFLATSSLFDLPVNIALPDSLLSTSNNHHRDERQQSPKVDETEIKPCLLPEPPSLPPDFLQKATQIDTLNIEQGIEEIGMFRHNDKTDDPLWKDHIQMESEDAQVPIEEGNGIHKDDADVVHGFGIGFNSRSLFADSRQRSGECREIEKVHSSLGFSALFAQLE